MLLKKDVSNLKLNTNTCVPQDAANVDYYVKKAMGRRTRN